MAFKVPAAALPEEAAQRLIRAASGRKLESLFEELSVMPCACNVSPHRMKGGCITYSWQKLELFLCRCGKV